MQPNFPAPTDLAKENSFDPLCEELKDLILQPDLIDRFEDHMVCQLVEGLLFEGLIVYSQSIISENYCKDFNFHKIYNNKIEFSIAGTTLQCVAYIGPFGRIRVADKSVKIMNSRFYSRANIKSIVSLLSRNNVNTSQLLCELTQSILLCRWNTENIQSHRLSRQLLPFHSLKTAIHENNLYPHCFNNQTEFSLHEHIQYGSQEANSFQLSWLAIRKSLLNSRFPVTEETHYPDEIGAKEYIHLMDVLKQHGVNCSHYTLVPIPPWQLLGIEQHLNLPMEKKDIISLGAAGDLYQTSQSLYSLINVSQPEKANIKMPLKITSSEPLSKFQKKAVYAATTLSSWLQEIVANDSFLQKQQSMLILRDYAEIALTTSNSKDLTTEKIEITTLLGGEIGATYQQSLFSRLGNAESAVPYSALTLHESDGNLFIAQWLKEFGIESWVSRLLDVVLIPVWHMLVHHGIAFEAHAKNLTLIHKQGWPEKIVLHDISENILYAEDFLSNGIIMPKFDAVDSSTSNNSKNERCSINGIEHLRDLFMATTYIYNFSELSFRLDKHCGYPEDLFWKMIKEKISNYESSGVTDIKRINRINAIEKPIAIESVLQKKIKNSSNSEHYEHQVSNALAPSQHIEIRAAQ